jgi:hypothetical protein
MTRFPLAAVPLAVLLVQPAAAQRVVHTSCQSPFGGFIPEYGRAVSVGAGPSELWIGAPEAEDVFGDGDRAGGVFPAVGPDAYGDDEGDRLGAAVAAGLDLDGDALPDGAGGAPGDDDAGDGAGSVRALAGAGGTLYTVHGDAAGDGFGTSLAALGDVDGDGRGDLLVGAPQLASGGPGYARVLSGANGAVLRTHPGTAAGDRQGLGLIGLADLDGDGVPDYAVGAPGEAGAGRVRVHSGANGAVLRTHAGAAAGDEFGYALGARTDVDRDGIEELVVGAPRAGLAAGSALVLSGATGSQLLAVGGTWSQDRFGAAVAGVGDFDGDGHGDLVVGAPELDPQGPMLLQGGTGLATVFSGADGSALARMGGSQQAALGISVAGGADFDGDGLGDALIGGVLQNDGYGAASCVTGIGRSSGERVDRGPENSTLLGRSLAALGDLDGDGAGELLIGAPHAKDPGGQVTGMARLVSGRTGAVIRQHYGSFHGDRLGQAVANAGDVDGDGLDDLLVGSADPQETGFVPGVGYARIYSGATGALLHHLPFSGPPAGARAFGAALAGNGDVDGDGRADVIVGGAFNNLHPGGHTGQGRVQVHSGATGELLHAFDGDAGLTEALGASVSLLSDVDGDGRDELLIGVPGRVINQPFAVGVVELRSGADGTRLHAYTTGYIATGTALARLGDLDGDGLEDFATSTWDVQPIWSMGSVHAFSSNSHAELWAVEDQTPYQGVTFGFTLGGAGDWNGDGLQDLAVGIPGTIDWHGQSIGAVEVLSGVDGAGLAYHVGFAGWDYFGYSVAGLGDVNGDGLPELAIGAPTEPANNQGANVGWNRVHVVLSNPLVQHDHCLLSVNSSGQAATIAASGLGSVTLNDLSLDVVGAAPGQYGIFRMGTETTVAPFGSGFRCTAGVQSRLSGVLSTDAYGALHHQVDLSQNPGAKMLPGSSWSIQFLFRDAGSIDTSDAVLIDWLP